MTGSVREEQAATAEEGRVDKPFPNETAETTFQENGTADEGGRGDCCRRRLPALNKEARGICFINIAIGSVVSANVFLSTGLLYLARAEAGCLKPGPCEGKVHGMHPDSLLTNIAWIGGLIIAFFLPIIGSIVDYTPYRRHVGIFASVCLVALNASQIGISESTWWPMAVVQVVATFVFFVLRVISLAYVPELSEGVDKQNDYNSIFGGIQFLSMLICMVLIIALSMIPGVDNVGSARIGQIILVAVSTIALTYSWWRLMEDRPPIDTVPEGSSVVKAGFVKIYKTSTKVFMEYKAITWFFISAMCTGAGQAGFASTVVTVAMSLLGMNSTMVGLLTLIIILFGIPGSGMSYLATKVMDPLRSLMASLMLLVVTTATASAVLTSPDRQNLSFLFAALWGCGMGWSMAAEQTFFATVIPAGAPAELYGTWYFFSAVLSWVPPLIFSLLNENQVSMQWGLASIAIFFLLALLLLLPIGGYDKALGQATEIDDDIPAASIRSSLRSSGRRRSSVAIFPPSEIVKL